jgi:hypothetical protein
MMQNRKSATEAARQAMVRLLSRPVAAWEYHFKPELRDPFGGPFNGQQGRQSIFREVVELLSPVGVIETGTFRGSTTDFMGAHSRLPIWSVEARLRFFHYARMRLNRFPHVQVSLGDSRTFLRRLAADPNVPKRGIFFYLDAHWYEDLPLRDEVGIISSHWSDFVIMVDDFQVPGDSGYAFDDYGGQNQLSLAYLGSLDKLGLKAFFPAIHSADETGMKRGSVILADANATQVLLKARTLRIAER